MSQHKGAIRFLGQEKKVLNYRLPANRSFASNAIISELASKKCTKIFAQDF